MNEFSANYPNCAKETERGEEWNIIAMFFEWLSQKKRAYLARNELDGPKWPIPYVVPVAIHLSDLMRLWHEYIGVDEAELERERRRLLDEVEKKQRE